jgi:hypothetical protein
MLELKIAGSEQKHEYRTVSRGILLGSLASYLGWNE